MEHPGSLVLLLVWGTIVGLDLVSGPQALLSRPLVAGTVAGAIAGDPAAGLRVGLLLELFALDVLPVGATRYPDYGPGTVAAAALVAANGDWTTTLGLAAGVAVIAGLIGDWSLVRLRHQIARSIQRRSDLLARGDRDTIRRLQYASIGRDAIRSLGLTALALAIARMVDAALIPDPLTGQLLTIVAIGAGAAAALGGAIRSAGRGRRLGWLAAGAVAGSTLAWLR